MQFQEAHDALTKTVPDASKGAVEYFRDNHYEATEDVYQAALDMNEWLEELEPIVSPNHSVDHGYANQSSSAFALAHLPQIKLPPFDGIYHEWENFRDRFTSLIINNKDLSDFSRMHFLSSCLKDSALECIDGIPVTSDNFNVAWTALTSRYENKRRLINVHLSELMNLNAVTRESVYDLQTLRDKVNIAVAALRNLGRAPEELWDDILVFIVTQKLDPITRKAWNLKATDTESPPSYADLSRFLMGRARALEEFKPANAVIVKPPIKPACNSRIHSANSTTKSPSGCALCKGKHYLNVCPRFLNKNSSQRREFVKQAKRCFNCLSHSHSVQECPSKYSCRLCQQQHHTLLHSISDAPSLPATDSLSSDQRNLASDRQRQVNSLLASAATPRAPVLLATAWVTITASSGRTASVRALLD